jgi:phenylpropionate dioxygenase-like ring-hydroxylating dioxygenase large terminal subunit
VIVLRSDDVALRTVVPLVVDREEYVVWRGASGTLGSAPRQCPHLDRDLTDARVVGDELVCPGHGWSFDCSGRAAKRNEFGRADDKGTVAHLAVWEHGGVIRVAR